MSNSWARVYQGRAAVQAWAEEFSNKRLDATVEPERYEQHGDRIAVAGRVEVSARGEPSRQARVSWIFEVRDGFVVRGEGFDDDGTAFARVRGDR